MKIFGGLLLGLLAASYCVADEGAEITDVRPYMLTPEARKLYWDAHDQDKLGDTKGVPEIEGGYRSPFGIQIHPACFEYAERKQGVRRAVAEEVAEKWFRDSYASIVKCQLKYPELKPYLGEWVSQFRRTRITCSEKSQSQLKVGARNLALGLGLRTYLNEHEREGLMPTDEVEPAAKAHRTVIMLPWDNFAGLTQGSTSPVWMQDSLIHEVLHSTHANNRWDHGDVEFEPGNNDKCGDDNIKADRVNVISALCSGEVLAGTGKSATENMFDRMSDCGDKKCEKFFAEDHFNTKNLLDYLSQPWMPTDGLGSKAAQSLCARIKDEGACQYDMKREGDTLTRVDAKLVKLGGQMRERLHRVFNPGVARFSPELLALYPERTEALKALGGTACFKTVFRESANGALSLPLDNPFAKSISSHSRATPQRYFRDAVNAFERATRGSAECQNGEGNKVRLALAALAVEVNRAFSSSSYQSLVDERYSNRTESYRGFVEFSRTGGAELRKIIGEKLFDEYLATLDTNHYQSVNVSCDSMGYNGHGRLVRAMKLLAYKLKQAVPHDCSFTERR